MSKVIVFSIFDNFFTKDIVTNLLMSPDGHLNIPAEDYETAVSFRLDGEAKSYASSFGHEVVITISNSLGVPENVDDRLRPLFEAMMQGRTIKSIVCYHGQKYKFDRSKDFIILNVLVDYYDVNFMAYNDDFVRCSCEHSPFVKYCKNHLTTQKGFQFYMGWVREFEL